MKCSICGHDIDQQHDPDGTVIWDQGHNAQPINNGRCCSGCNEIVILRRIADIRTNTRAKEAGAES